MKWNAQGTSYNTVEVIPVEAYCNADFTKYTLLFNEFKLNVSKDQDSFKHHGNVMVSCNAQNAGKSVKFNCFQSYCSTVICADPVKMCNKRFSKVGAMNTSEKCHFSCLKNGRCHTGGISDSDNRRLEETNQQLFSSYKRRFLWSHEDWNNYHNQEETSTPQNQQESAAPANDSQNAQENDESTDNTQNQQMVQNDKKGVYKRTIKADIAQNINYTGNWKCWCYSDGKEHGTCNPLVEDDD